MESGGNSQTSRWIVIRGPQDFEQAIAQAQRLRRPRTLGSFIQQPNINLDGFRHAVPMITVEISASAQNQVVQAACNWRTLRRTISAQTR
jgi:hypothetical protein